MLKIILLFVVLFFSRIGICDTATYWHVYLNDSLIAKFNESSKDLEIRLKKSDLNSFDTLRVKLKTCALCSDCFFTLELFLEIKENTPSDSSRENAFPLKIAIADILKLEKKYDPENFPFYHVTEFYNRNFRHKLFHLVLI